MKHLLLVQHGQLVCGGGGRSTRNLKMKVDRFNVKVVYIYIQAHMEKEKQLVNPSWVHYRATGHTVMNV